MTTLSDGDGSKLEELAFSPDGQLLAAARHDKIFLWDVASPARPRLLRTLDAPVASPAGDGPIPFSQQDLAFSPGGTILASATGTDQVTVWNVTDPAHASRLATLGGAGTPGRCHNPPHPDGKTGRVLERTPGRCRIGAVAFVAGVRGCPRGVAPR